MNNVGYILLIFLCLLMSQWYKLWISYQLGPSKMIVWLSKITCMRLFKNLRIYVSLFLWLLMTIAQFDTYSWLWLGSAASLLTETHRSIIRLIREENLIDFVIWILVLLSQFLLLPSPSLILFLSILFNLIHWLELSLSPHVHQLFLISLSMIIHINLEAL